MALEGMFKDVGRIMVKGDEMDDEMERGKNLCKGLDEMDQRIENRCWVMDRVLEYLCRDGWKCWKYQL